MFPALDFEMFHMYVGEQWAQSYWTCKEIVLFKANILPILQYFQK